MTEEERFDASLRLTASRDDILTCYTKCLRQHWPDLAKRFQDRRNNKTDIEAACAEAIVFYHLTYDYGYSPDIIEDIRSGGPDFLCSRVSRRFVVEVKCMTAPSVAKKSYLPPDYLSDDTPRWFSFITKAIKEAAQKAAKQLSGHQYPTLLAVVCSHPAAPVLFSDQAAEYVLTSEPYLVGPIGSAGASHLETTLASAAFFRPNTGLEEARLRSVSAVLLVQSSHDSSAILGILNPDPQYPFDVALLPNTPFVRLKESWRNGQRLVTERVIADPCPRKLRFSNPSLVDQICRRLEERNKRRSRPNNHSSEPASEE